MNCSHCIQSTNDKLKHSKEILEQEKSALDKKVRELTFKLEVRAEDLSKKEVGIGSELSCDLGDLENCVVYTVTVEVLCLHRNTCSA